MMVRPRVLGSEAPGVDQEPRTVPINLRETMQIVDDYEIKLPAGYVSDELPDPVTLDLGARIISVRQHVGRFAFLFEKTRYVCR